ncbi:SMC5-SMC6 complex localization factor protein 1 [Conglomerata obtusa]
MSLPPNTAQTYFTTTAISNTELSLILEKLPSTYTYEPSLTSRTSFLFTFRCVFTDKYIQALKWKIPIVHIEWLYDTNISKNTFVMDTLQGCRFTVSNVSNDVFGKYCELLGATWMEDLDRGVDFVISEFDTQKFRNITEFKNLYKYKETVECDRNLLSDTKNLYTKGIDNLETTNNGEYIKTSNSLYLEAKNIDKENTDTKCEIEKSKIAKTQNKICTKTEKDEARSNISLNMQESCKYKNNNNIAYNNCRKTDRNNSEHNNLDTMYHYKHKLEKDIHNENIYDNVHQNVCEKNKLKETDNFMDEDVPESDNKENLQQKFIATSRNTLDKNEATTANTEFNKKLYAMQSMYHGKQKLAELNNETNKIVGNNTNCSDKISYALKHKIPIINPSVIFYNEWFRYKKEYKFEAIKKKGLIFDNLIFLLDQNLPKRLFNCLKRIIIENGGIRISQLECKINYIITSPKSKIFVENEYIKEKILHYQFIFDCFDCKALLYSNFYMINDYKNKMIFNGIMCYVDPNLKDFRNILINKIQAMGGLVKNNIASGVTHVIVKNKKEYKMCDKMVSYKVVLFDWIDQCLYNGKIMKEDKYIIKKPALNLYKEKPIKSVISQKVVKYLNEEKEIIFQFTGLATILKNKAIDVLKKYNIKYIDSDKFENCTHLIMGTLNTSEKFMCALSRGLWILIPDFINHFDGSKNFSYSNFEWTNENILDKNELKMVEAIQKWRKKIFETGKFAFSGWKVKFYCEESKKQSLNLLIECGGGSITVGSEATHVFVSKKYFKEVKEEKYFSINYIYSYLLK